MNESYKLSEAEYFFSQMLDVQRTPKHFNYNLSAFLTAARSILQYALEEARGKSGGQKWFDLATATHPSILFLKDKRNLNIHVEPVLAQTTIGIETSVPIGIEESVKIHIFEEEQLISYHKTESRPTEIPERREESAAQYTYRFTDWTGSEDVVQLSRLYLQALEAVVADGFSRAFLS
jgi:hypothetical protein